MQLVFFTINFIIFVTVLLFLLKKPISKYLTDRKTAFVNGNVEAKTAHDNAIHLLNKIKQDIKDLEKDGRDHLEEVVDNAKLEAKQIIANTEAYSKSMLLGTEEMVKEELETAKNKEVTNFIHNIITKTKSDVKSKASSVDYDSIYIKDYFAESKRVEG